MKEGIFHLWNQENSKFELYKSFITSNKLINSKSTKLLLLIIKIKSKN